MRINSGKERFLTASDAKLLDKKAAEKFGMPVILLMENAGRCISEEALDMLGGRKGRRVAVFCGTGNNGGDGFCAARHLLARGVKPDIYLCGRISDVRNEAKVNLDVLLRMKQKIKEDCSRRLQPIKAKKYDLIIDALLGVGLRGPVRPACRKIIEAINASGSRVLSVDIPSGLEAARGKPADACVKAEKTVTFVAKKFGMASKAGKGCCGEIVVRSIGIAL
ncbi:MAG: NAD(P)H-hydrate epimerase [Candidatus Omnitrophica bacterium]|nr:NAD(P)H-hydrate epimerase [Candidatus Omnitrophota bacterium]